jgi:Spy/CpxP family protein refolding chaperone
MMNYSRKLALSVILAAGLGAAVPVLAEQGCAPMGGHESHYEHHGKDVEQHHQQLHDALKLTAAQEAGWKKLIESEQPRPSTPAAEQREDWSKLSTPERAEKMLALTRAREQQMGDYVVALKAFYATLSTEQKKTFEDVHASQRGEMRRMPAAPGTPDAAKAPAKP